MLYAKLGSLRLKESPDNELEKKVVTCLENRGIIFDADAVQRWYKELWNRGGTTWLLFKLHNPRLPASNTDLLYKIYISCFVLFYRHEECYMIHIPYVHTSLKRPKHVGGHPIIKLHQKLLCICWYWCCIQEESCLRTDVYTRCFTTLRHNCRRWFPTSLWSKKVHINMCPILDGYGVMTVWNSE